MPPLRNSVFLQVLAPRAGPLSLRPRLASGVFMVLTPPPRAYSILVGSIEYDLYCTLLIQNDKSHVARARLLSNAAKNAGLWITTLPLSKELVISDTNFRLGARFRLGLPPQDDLPKQCHCGTILASDPAHFLSCQSFRRFAVTHRHSMLLQTVGVIAQGWRNCLP